MNHHVRVTVVINILLFKFLYMCRMENSPWIPHSWQLTNVTSQCYWSYFQISSLSHGSRESQKQWKQLVTWYHGGIFVYLYKKVHVVNIPLLRTICLFKQLLIVVHTPILFFQNLPEWQREPVNRGEQSQNKRMLGMMGMWVCGWVSIIILNH